MLPKRPTSNRLESNSQSLHQTQGGSSRTLGSVRGAARKGGPYRDPVARLHQGPDDTLGGAVPTMAQEGAWQLGP